MFMLKSKASELLLNNRVGVGKREKAGLRLDLTGLERVLNGV
jgi:hypothetical protein